MAVDAALHDVAFVVELRAVLALELRQVLGHGEFRRGPALQRQLGLVRRIRGVQGQRPIERLGQPLDRDVVGPVRVVRARAVAAVDRAVGVQHEDRERLVGVELKQRQVQAVGRDDPHPDELLQQRPQRGDRSRPAPRRASRNPRRECTAAKPAAAGRSSWPRQFPSPGRCRSKSRRPRPWPCRCGPFARGSGRRRRRPRAE